MNTIASVHNEEHGKAGRPPNSQLLYCPLASAPGLDWLHFTERTGTPGAEWVAEFNQYTPALVPAQLGVNLLRSGHIDRGGELILEVRSNLPKAGETTPSVRLALSRFLLAIEAYYFYCKGEWESAVDSLNHARTSLIQAIAKEHFLFLLAMDCAELTLHRARVCRNQRCWSEMWRHVSIAEQMITGAVPLCEPLPGAPIYCSTICDFLMGLEPPLSAEEQVSVRGLINNDERRRHFDDFVRAMYRQPGFVIEYY